MTLIINNFFEHLNVRMEMKFTCELLILMTICSDRVVEVVVVVVVVVGGGEWKENRYTLP